MELSGKTVYGPVLKTTQLSAHAQNHASPKRCHFDTIRARDGQTDGIAIANTVLAMRALRAL